MVSPPVLARRTTVQPAQQLMTSGEFAFLTRMSRKALRLYDDLGLLRPAQVNPTSKYRSYAAEQLETAKRITTLRSLGMSLESIGELLRAWDGPDFRVHLERQRGLLLHRAAETQQALLTLDHLLDHSPRTYTVSHKWLAPRQALSIRRECLPDDACTLIMALEQQLRIAVDADQADREPVMVIYHEPERDEVWDTEVCLPLPEQWAGRVPDDAALISLPAGEVAFTVHEGEYGGTNGMQDAFVTLWTWMQAQGRSPAAAPYEVYLVDQRNTDEPQTYRTEVAWPLM
jgi:DNA-binding transcriptional MerR regulator